MDELEIEQWYDEQKEVLLNAYIEKLDSSLYDPSFEEQFSLKINALHGEFLKKLEKYNLTKAKKEAMAKKIELFKQKIQSLIQKKDGK